MSLEVFVFHFKLTAFHHQLLYTE